MKEPISRDTAEARVITKYHKLYKPLVDLVDALQYLEPGGTLVDDVSIVHGKDNRVRIAYVAKPIMLTITDKNRVFILRVIASDGNEGSTVS